MELRNIQSHKYYIEHTDAKPIYVEIPAHNFTTSFNRKIKPYKFILAYFNGKEMDWITLEGDIERIAKRLIELDRKDPRYYENIYGDWKKKFLTMRKVAEDLFLSDFSVLNDNELADKLKTYVKFFEDYVKFPAFLDAFMFYADRKFLGLLNEYCQQKRINANPNELFSILSAPVYESFINEEENKLLDIAILKARGKDIKKLIKKHGIKYFYITSSYADYKEYNRQFINRKINHIIKKKDFKENRQHLINKKLKLRILKKYKFTSEILRFIKLTELFVKWQDERKVFTLMHISLDFKFIQKIAKRRKIKLELLKYCEYKELILASVGRIDIKDVDYRLKKPFISLYKNGKIISRDFSYAGKFLDKISQQPQKEIGEIRGLAASLGRAIGRVKIIKKFEDTLKLKQGDVMVISMTRPEHTIVMKKTSAIVTDDGGITSHAAIVSRELKKPCIIGTKIATKVLRNGQIVEVDANHGVVRVLK